MSEGTNSAKRKDDGPAVSKAGLWEQVEDKLMLNKDDCVSGQRDGESYGSDLMMDEAFTDDRSEHVKSSNESEESGAGWVGVSESEIEGSIVTVNPFTGLEEELLSGELLPETTAMPEATEEEEHTTLLNFDWLSLGAPIARGETDSPQDQQPPFSRLSAAFQDMVKPARCVLASCLFGDDWTTSHYRAEPSAHIRIFHNGLIPPTWTCLRCSDPEFTTCNQTNHRCYGDSAVFMCPCGRPYSHGQALNEN